MGAPLKIPYAPDRPAALIGTVLTAAFVIFAGLTIGYFFIFHPWLKAQAAGAWIKTPCLIRFSQVESQGSVNWTTYHIDINYQYRVADQLYQSSQYDFDPFDSGSYDSRNQVVRENPKGKETICYVNPQDPTEAVLSRTFGGSYLGWVFPICLGVPGLMMLWGVPARARRWTQFGESDFELKNAPAVIGDLLEGAIQLSPKVQLDSFAIKLVCFRRAVSGAGRGIIVREVLLWQESKEVRPDDSGSVPVAFKLPENGAAIGLVNRRDRIFWRLEISAKVPGAGYKAQFVVPVIKKDP